MNWLWNGSSNVVFKTKDIRKKERVKKSVLIFVSLAVAAVFIVVFFFLLSYDFDVSNLLSSTGGEIVGEDISYVVKEVSGEENIMMYCTDDDEKGINFLAVVKFNMTDKEIRVFSIPVNEKVLFLNSQKSTATECYNSAGATQLLNSVKAYTGVAIDKYIGCKEGNIEGIVANFDSLKINFTSSEKFTRGSDVISYEPGTHTISDDSVSKILTYSNSDKNIKSNMLIAMFKQYFNTKNLDNREIIYSNIVSQVETNIGVIDFTDYKDHLVTLSSDTVDKKYIVSETLDEFKLVEEEK